MQYRKFEDIPVWNESKKFVNDIYNLIFKNQKLAKDYSLTDQLKRASYSIMLNIAEGFERGSNKEFANFLNIAKGSAGEVRSILYILKENDYIKSAEFEDLYVKIETISAQLSNFRKFLISNVTRKK
jgi:four helix bundle protein